MNGKQCRPWSDAALCDIWSGSVYTFCLGMSVPNFKGITAIRTNKSNLDSLVHKPSPRHFFLFLFIFFSLACGCGCAINTMIIHFISYDSLSLQLMLVSWSYFGTHPCTLLLYIFVLVLVLAALWKLSGILYIYMRVTHMFSWLSLSRLRLSRITAYLEVKLWSLF